MTTLGVQKAQISFITINDWITTPRYRLCFITFGIHHYSYIVAFFQCLQRIFIVIFRQRERQMIVGLGQCSFAAQNFSIAIKLHVRKSIMDRSILHAIPNYRKLFKWQIASTIQANSRNHILTTSFADKLFYILNQLIHKGITISKETISLCDTSILDFGINATASSIQTCSSATSTRFRTDLMTTKIVRSKVQNTSQNTFLRTLTGLSISID